MFILFYVLFALVLILCSAAIFGAMSGAVLAVLLESDYHRSIEWRMKLGAAYFAIVLLFSLTAVVVFSSTGAAALFYVATTLIAISVCMPLIVILLTVVGYFFTRGIVALWLRCVNLVDATAALVVRMRRVSKNKDKGKFE
jgi:hypothetical protein